MSTQYATFTVGDLFFGIDVLRVQEVLRYQEMTSIPLAPRCGRGLDQLARPNRHRHRHAPQARAAASPGGRPPMNMVVRSEDGPVSLLVDEIGDVLQPDQDLFETPRPDNAPKISRELLQGVYKLRAGCCWLSIRTGRWVSKRRRAPEKSTNRKGFIHMATQLKNPSCALQLRAPGSTTARRLRRPAATSETRTSNCCSAKSAAWPTSTMPATSIPDCRWKTSMGISGRWPSHQRDGRRAISASKKRRWPAWTSSHVGNFEAPLERFPARRRSSTRQSSGCARTSKRFIVEMARMSEEHNKGDIDVLHSARQVPGRFSHHGAGRQRHGRRAISP